MELKIEYVPKEQLKAYANNAKIHTAEQVEQIKKSIEEFGFNDPIAIWHDNEIIEGHGRLLAVMEMDDIKEVPVIRLDELTDEQRRAYMLVHNKLTMNTNFDFDLVGVELEEIESIDLTDLGFTEAELLEFTVGDNINMTPHLDSSSKSFYDNDNAEGYNDYSGRLNEEAFREELNEYEERANNSLTTKRVILIYRNEEEMNFIKRLLRLKDEQELNVVYDIRDIMGVRNAESKK